MTEFYGPGAPHSPRCNCSICKPEGVISEKPLKMLIDADWLRNKIKNDPDEESCEAGPAPEGLNHGD